MDTFDKNDNFKTRYLSNRETLLSIYKQILLSDIISTEMIEIYDAIDGFNGTKKPTVGNSGSLLIDSSLDDFLRPTMLAYTDSFPVKDNLENNNFIR